MDGNCGGGSDCGNDCSDDIGGSCTVVTMTEIRRGSDSGEKLQIQLNCTDNC